MTYEEYKAIGMCPRCGNEPFGHYVYYADCLYKMTMYRDGDVYYEVCDVCHAAARDAGRGAAGGRRR